MTIAAFDVQSTKSLRMHIKLNQAKKILHRFDSDYGLIADSLVLQDDGNLGLRFI